MITIPRLRRQVNHTKNIKYVKPAQRELLGQFFYASIKFLGRKIANANGLYEGRLEIFRDKLLDNCKSPQAGSDTIYIVK